MFESFYEKITAALSVLAGFLIGGWSQSLSILLVCMVLDYVSGWAKAIKTGTLNSTVARYGILSKFLMFIPIILSNLVDLMMKLNGTCLTMCVIFYIASEALSILENLAELIPLPQQLVDILEKVKKDNDDKKVG